jgi:flagellar biosynthesis/type III secretory pathway chaperone
MPKKIKSHGRGERIMSEQAAVDNTIDLQEALKKIMNREVHVLRELMNNMRREQEVHMNHEVAYLRPLMDERESIFHAIMEIRETRIGLMEQIADIIGVELSLEGKIDQQRGLDLLGELKGPFSNEISSMKVQIISLLDQLKTQTEKNNYLIQGKLSRTRELMQRLSPKDKNTQYGSQGNHKKASVAVKLINREV